MTGPNRFAERTRIDDLELSRHVARIESPDGQLRGTGFFVAPGVVFTAAHVVFAAGEWLESVRVVPSHGDVGTEPVRAAVAARSTAGLGSAIWPFPDMAVLELEEDAEWVGTHPCVWLTEADPSGLCHAFGYPVREFQVDPAGGPAQFVYEGRTGDRYLQLSSGQAIEGLSGAPLVCPTQRGVVGVMAATRDRSQALGGWAAPILDLASALPGAPPALVAAYGKVVSKNREAVLRDRAQWHRVLPIDGAEHALRHPWGTFRKGRRTLPTEMLLADAGVVPFLFHDDGLDDARRWCELPSEFELRHFAGPGGAGKTRWAIELCRTMADRGWVVGFWHGRDLSLDVVDIPLPRLIVIDYVETLAPQKLRDIFESLRRRATALAPVRIVLLTRTVAGHLGLDVLDQVSKEADLELRNVLGDAPDPVEVGDLSERQRKTLYRQAYTEFHRAWNRATPTASRPPNLRAARYAVPLEVLLEAFDHALSGGTASSGRSPAQRALEHEQRHWPPGPGGLIESDRRLAVALATLAGADDRTAAGDLLELIPALSDTAGRRLRSETITWLHGLYGGDQLLNPMRPDRLGEALVASALAGEDDRGHELLSRVLRLPDDRQLARTLGLLARLTVTDPAVLELVAAVVSECHAELAERATRQSRGRAGRPGSLDVALGLQRLYSAALADRLTELAAAAEDDVVLLGLALSYNRTGDLAAVSGRSDLATDLYLRALLIRARTWITHHSDRSLARELSISFIRLGDTSLRTSQTKDAKRFYGRSLRLRRWLHWAEPDNEIYARDLAIAYDKCAAVLEGQLVVDYYLRSANIREGLMTGSRNPKIFRDLAISYDKLGDLAKEQGLAVEAKNHYEMGLRIRERLRRDHPEDTTIGRMLSNSYDRLGDWEADMERADSARHLYEKARAIRRRLCEAEPGNRLFARDLANSFNRLGTVARDHAEATSLFREGLGRIQRLAETDPHDTTLAQDLCVFLMSLGDVAREAGRAEEAQAHYRQGLTEAQRLLALEPENIMFARDVGIFYLGLGSLADSPRAETLFGAAVHFRRDLHRRRPDRTDLAEELGYALMRLATRMPEETAEILARETLELLESYDVEERHLGRLGREVWADAMMLRGHDDAWKEFQ